MPSSARAHSTTRAPVSASARCEHRVAGAHDGDHVGERGQQVHGGRDADRRAAADAVRCRRHRRQQLAAAEARAAAGGEQDADDRRTASPAARKRIRRALATTVSPLAIAVTPAAAGTCRRFTTTSTRARSSMPLWLVADMLNTPWRADDLALAARARRAARRGTPRCPGLPALSADGIARCEQDAAVPGVRAERRRLAAELLLVRGDVAPARPSSSGCCRGSRRSPASARRRGPCPRPSPCRA